jgi:hypothetical protein
MHITVRIKSNYGTQMLYPVCDTGKLFARLVGRKTLTLADIETIKALGYTVRVEQTQPTEL